MGPRIKQQVLQQREARMVVSSPQQARRKHSIDRSQFMRLHLVFIRKMIENWPKMTSHGGYGGLFSS